MKIYAVRNGIVIKSSSELEAVIHELIPLSLAMGVRVGRFDGNLLELNAPLEPNINHQLSAFGGSLTALSALTGWGLTQLLLGKLGLTGNTVVTHSEASFLRPVRSEIVCRSRLPDTTDVFERNLKNTGRAELALATEIVNKEGIAMTTLSRFVVHGKHREKT